ncbi:BTAD domain-containing putative transcriptional regulator [Actinocorallia sp. B10E7]|uniref:ATP-binding protein n=1 Tax=Actinocorallia sp. B10E7 TaxID=3153558 RepID=UPI00325D5436
MRYRVLGTTQAIREDGSAVPLGGARRRALLTALALEPGRTRSVPELVDDVWGAEPPADAAGELQVLAGRLLRGLGQDAIWSDDGGYGLVADPDDIDAYRFERLADEGALALADGDAEKAFTLLDEALALWHGPALADLPDGAGWSAHWEARRSAALRARLTAGLALGRAEEILPELTALCVEHPLDEPLHILRLRALRDVGRPAQALAAYDSVRRALADRLGTEPGLELRALHAKLLRPLPEPEGPSRPEPLTRPGNLPARLTSFVGREDELAAIRDDLARHRLITLTGTSGSGKTRLALEAAASESAAGNRPDGVWTAELTSVEAGADATAVAAAVVTALGARDTALGARPGTGPEELRASAEQVSEDPRVRLIEHCAHRRMLLVLDNCEHVIEAVAELVRRLLARCPGLSVLATSREPLNVPGEAVRPVEPLPVPAALRLLAERGAAARPGFRAEDDPVSCAEICRRLDGLPLAIELAAARLRLLTARQIADRLDDRFRLLTGGSRTMLPRHRIPRAVVDWSWDLLPPEQRTVLSALSVFAGGCDLEAAEAICGPGVLETLGALVDEALVVAVPDGPGGQTRYRLLETVSEYAGERLDESGGRQDVERRHLVHFRELARNTDPLLRGPRQLIALERLETEYENLRAALRRAIALRDEQEALCLVGSLCWYWSLRKYKTDARTFSAATFALGPDPFAAPVQPAPPLYDSYTDSPPPWTPELLEEARRGARLIHLANSDDGRPQRTAGATGPTLRGIIKAYRPGLPQVCRVPGFLWFHALLLAGDRQRLNGALDAAVRTCRELGYDWELGLLLQKRGDSAETRQTARRDADESLELFRRAGDSWGTATALSCRAKAEEDHGEYRAAAADYREAIREVELLGAWAQVGPLRAGLGTVLAELGEWEAAERLLHEALQETRRHGLTETIPYTRIRLARLLGRTGRIDEARGQLDAAREEFTGRAPTLFESAALGVGSWLDNLDGRYGTALQKARVAMTGSDDPQAYTPLVNAARALAGLGGAERATVAARLLGAYDALLPSDGLTSTIERESKADAERDARSVLGDAAYEDAHAEGGGLTVEEAAALV